MFIQEIAYNFMVKNRINNLNFNLSLLKDIALSHNFKLCSYSSNKSLIYNLNLKEKLKLNAFTFLKDDRISIFYNDELDEIHVLFNILHEFGYIFLKHSTSDSIVGYSNDTLNLNKTRK